VCVCVCVCVCVLSVSSERWLCKENCACVKFRSRLIVVSVTDLGGFIERC